MPDRATRAATSASPSRRQPPTFSRPSFNGPKPTRRSECTLWPIPCTMRRTWRWRPSRMTIRSSARPESRLPGVTRERLDLGRSSDAVLELHAGAKRLEVRWCRVADHRRDVLLGDLVARMRETKRELAVIGEQQQARRVSVEPAHWKKAVTRLPFIADDVEHRRSLLLVARGRDHPERLVDDHVAMPCHRA